VLNGMSGWNGIILPERLSSVMPEIFMKFVSLKESPLNDDGREINI